jgi:predicted HD phosphohydrolase
MADDLTVNPPRADFDRMDEAKQADWMIIASEHRPLMAGLADRVIQHLMLLDGDFGGFPVDRLQHCLQCATLAEDGGEDEEFVVAALLHDIGDTLGAYNHPDVAAAILKPFVSEDIHWMVEQHGIFQGYYYFHHLGMDRDMRERFRGHPNFARTADFCERYDQTAFSRTMTPRGIEHFAPMVRRVFAAPKRSIYAQAASS